MGDKAGARETVLLIASKIVLFLVLPLYVVLRVFFLATSDLGPWTFFSWVVFFAELYFIIHASNYLVSFIRSTKHYGRLKDSVAKRYGSEPHVAVLIPVYNEPPQIVDETVAAAMRMDYGNKSVYLLDDSDRSEIVTEMEAIAKKHGVQLVRRNSRVGFKAGSINHVVPRLESGYIAVFDADQQPMRDFLSKIIPIFEANADMGYVQTPQLPRKSPQGAGFVETAASASQFIFYRHICEGKGTISAQFSCGSNVVYRKTALESLKREEDGHAIYLDEWSVTEDYATSVLMHEKGWKSLFYNETWGEGLVPASLDAFEAQRARWAIGTTGVFLRYLPRILFGRNFSWEQKWEYFISGTYFFLGIANFIMIVNTAVFVLFDIPLYTSLPLVIFFFNTVIFYASQGMRGNGLKDLLYEQVLNFIMFPLYIKAVLSAITGRKASFSVTHKYDTSSSGSGSPDLGAQLATLLFCLFVFAIGVRTYLLGHEESLLFNLFWVAYTIAMLTAGIALVGKQYHKAGQTTARASPMPRLFGDGRQSWARPSVLFNQAAPARSWLPQGRPGMPS